jgi:hypothetical protein
MNKLLVIGMVVASVVGCAGYQAKLEDAQMKAKDLAVKVECRAAIVRPYVEYILEADLPAVLDGASIEDVLSVAGVVEAEALKVKEAFAACGKIELR